MHGRPDRGRANVQNRGKGEGAVTEKLMRTGSQSTLGVNCGMKTTRGKKGSKGGTKPQAQKENKLQFQKERCPGWGNQEDQMNY